MLTQDTDARFDHRHCLLCGRENPMSMRLHFSPNAEGNGVCAVFQSNRHLQGYEGLMHGGVISALLDSAMTNALFFLGIKAVTGEMTVKFKHPIPCNAILNISARLEKQIDPLYLLSATININETPMASATAKFMRADA